MGGDGIDTSSNLLPRAEKESDSGRKAQGDGIDTSSNLLPRAEKESDGGRKAERLEVRAKSQRNDEGREERVRNF